MRRSAKIKNGSSYLTQRPRFAVTGLRAAAVALGFAFWAAVTLEAATFEAAGFATDLLAADALTVVDLVTVVFDDADGLAVVTVSGFALAVTADFVFEVAILAGSTFEGFAFEADFFPPKALSQPEE